MLRKILEVANAEEESVKVAPSVLVLEGDSLTTDTYLAARPEFADWEVVHEGTAGHEISTIVGLYPSAIPPYYSAARSQNVIVLWAGTNDLANGQATATIKANLASYIAQAHATGFQVVIMTILPSGAHDATERERRVEINEWITAGSSGADVVVDPCELPQFDAQGDVADTTYFSDGTHITAAAYALITPLIVDGVIARLESGLPDSQDTPTHLFKKWLDAAGGDSEYKDTVAATLDKLIVAYGGEAQPHKARNAKIADLLAEIADVDDDAADFFVRAGITDATQKDAVETLVLQLKAGGVWSKCTAIYPFVGGTAGTHAVNLRADTFPITWSGTVTHNANGITGNGTTGFGTCVGLTKTILGATHHMGVYARTFPIGASFQNYCGTESGGSYYLIQINNAASPYTYEAYAGAPGTEASVAQALERTGLLLYSRSSTTDLKLYNGETAFATSVVAAVSTAAPDICLLARNNGSGSGTGFSAVNLAFASFGEALNALDVEVLDAAVQNYQTALGRRV